MTQQYREFAVDLRSSFCVLGKINHQTRYLLSKKFLGSIFLQKN
jgi:hypothetical protein